VLDWRPLGEGRRWCRLRRGAWATWLVALAVSSVTIVTPLPRTAPAAVAEHCAGGNDTASLNRLFAGQVDDLVGLDALRAVDLPDGRRLWLYQDAFVSPDGASRETLTEAGFAHNGALIQDGWCVRSIHGPVSSADRCPGPRLSSWVGGWLTGNCTRWFWPMGAAMGSDGLLAIFYASVTNPAGTGATDGAAPDGVWLARVDPRTLELVELAPAPDPGGDLLFGFAVETAGEHSYLFGHSYDQFNLPDPTSPPPSRTFVARVPAGRFDLVPEYWTGSGWSADRWRAAPVHDAGAGRRASIQPRRIDGTWVAVTKLDDWHGADLALLTAAAPQGPWTVVRTMVIPTKTLDGSTNTYLPHLLPQRSDLGNLVVSVSHNAWVMDPLVTARPALYRPTFFEIEPPPAMARTPLVALDPPLGLVATPPARALDTRPGARLTAGEVRAVDLSTTTPATARSAAVNLVAVDPAADGFLTAWSCDSDQPWVSSLNVVARRTQGAFSIVALSGARRICVASSVATHLVVDVFGAYVEATEPGAAAFSTVEPRRALDTRTTGGRLAPGVPRRVAIAPGASAVAVNVAVTEPSATGYATVYPCDSPRPLVANVNVEARRTISNHAQVAVSAGGELCVVANVAAHVVIDLVGTFTAGSSGWWYRAAPPTRLVDTREGIGAPVGPIARSAAGRRSEPADAVPALTAVPASAGAVVLTAVVVEPGRPGWMTVAPCDPRGYSTVALNSEGETMANLTVVATRAASGRDVCSYAMVPAHQVLDLVGWYEPG